MRVIFKDRRRVVHIPFVRKVEFKFPAHFPVDNLAHPVVSSLVLFEFFFLLHRYLIVSHWSFRDNKSSQVSRTLLSIRGDLNNVEVFSQHYYYYYYYCYLSMLQGTQRYIIIVIQQCLCMYYYYYYYYYYTYLVFVFKLTALFDFWLWSLFAIRSSSRLSGSRLFAVRVNLFYSLAFLLTIVILKIHLSLHMLPLRHAHGLLKSRF